MSDLETALTAQRRAADAFKHAAADVNDAAWNVPRAPGKWTTAQVVDHVGVSTRVARLAILGEINMGGIPKFLRWLPRVLYFKKVVATGFPKTGKGPPVFAPAPQPAPRPELIRQLDAEIDQLEHAVRALARTGTTHFEHTFFGRVAIADYVMFNAHHLDHHREQLPGAAR